MLYAYMSKKKLLIVSASPGAGHVRAAEAVRKTAAQSYLNLTVKHIDFFDFLNTPMKVALAGTYDLMIKQAPELWGFVYKRTNKPNVTNRLQKITKALKNIASSEYASEIRKFDPDYILFTHMFPADMYLGLIENKKLPSIPHGTLITDYGLHEMWITHTHQHFFVPTEKMHWQVRERDVKNTHVICTGIPVDPIFYEKKSLPELRKQLKFSPKEHIILCLSGGQGLTHLDEVINTIKKISTPATIVAVCGTNKGLLKKLKNLSCPPHISLQPLGWVNNIDEYMRIADVVVSKLGGMTTTECVTLGIPIIGIDPIPGQEEYNTQFILENKLGHIARTKEDLLYYISHIEKPMKRPIKKSANLILDTIERELRK